MPVAGLRLEGLSNHIEDVLKIRIWLQRVIVAGYAAGKGVDKAFRKLFYDIKPYHSRNSDEISQDGVWLEFTF